MSLSSFQVLRRVASQQTLMLDEIRETRLLDIRRTLNLYHSSEVPLRCPGTLPRILKLWYWPDKHQNDIDLTGHPPLPQAFIILKAYWNGSFSHYRLRGFLKLPHPLSRHALIVETKVFWLQMRWPTFSPSISVKNIVPRYSKFMKACATGDLFNVRRLVRNGHGSPNDLDEFGVPVLHASILI